jgi:hypothetical protein
MRVKIVQAVIAKMGIRPLSNAIGVNSKTVYKYKLGSACPTDETMMRVLMVVRERYPDLFVEYIDELRNTFSNALEVSSVPKTAGERPRMVISQPKPPRRLPRPKISRKKSAISETAEVTKFTIYENLGLSSPSDRITLAKILAIMQGVKVFSPAEIARKSGIPYEVVEKYVNMLVEANYVDKISTGAYQLAAKVQM